MNTMLTEKKKGFTLIEVVLVLAIAGLIILIVFLALPALQRSQRDTQRRTDMSRFTSQIAQYQSNNQGNAPSTQPLLDDFMLRYLKATADASSEFKDPSSGENYDATLQTVTSFSTTKPGVGDIFYYQNAKCNGESVVTGSGNRNIAIITFLEGNAYYCQDNS